ncbi:MAG: amidohydrolase [Clostridia bacterium]|nr:amidohydrolase [Clostridia bacterium]
MTQLLQHGDILVEAAGGYTCLRDGYLGIDGDTIDYLGTEPPQKAYDTVKDMTHRLIAPGLVNAHTHTGMTLLRGLGSDLPLQQWLFDTIFPVEDRMGPEDMFVGTELAMLEMLACGTTSFSDMYMAPGHTAKAILQSGMKANICRPLQSFDEGEDPYKSARMQEMLALYDQWHLAGNGRIRADFSIHAEYTCTPAMVRAAALEAQRRGTGLHIHLSETAKEQAQGRERRGVTPARWFADLGAFEGRCYAAHCVHLTEADRDLLLEKGVFPVHCPESNLKLGSGVAPVVDMNRRGLQVALGTDGAASNNNLNMIEELHLTGILHKGTLLEPTALSPAEALAMATRNGALAQGRTDTGSLMVGRKADLFALNMDAPHLTPSPDPLAALLYSAQASDVCLTMADGRILYENGSYLTLDKDRILYDAQKAVERLVG